MNENLDCYCSVNFYQDYASFFGPPAIAKRSYKLGSFPPFAHFSTHPSTLLPVWVFFRIGSLVFSKLWHGTRNAYKVVCDRARFFGKKFFAPKIGGMGQK